MATFQAVELNKNNKFPAKESSLKRVQTEIRVKSGSTNPITIAVTKV